MELILFRIFLGIFFRISSGSYSGLVPHVQTWIRARNQFLHFECKSFPEAFASKHSQSFYAQSGWVTVCIITVNLIFKCFRLLDRISMINGICLFDDHGDEDGDDGDVASVFGCLTSWYVQDHIAEVLEKWDNIDDEIWAKVFLSACLSGTKSGSPAYYRWPHSLHHPHPPKYFLIIFIMLPKKAFTSGFYLIIKPFIPMFISY